MTTLQERLAQTASEGRALLLDGAMGTLIMKHNLGEEDFRGQEFAQWPVLLRGNNDLLVLTRPDIISSIHRAYLEAGADLICTCTFSSQRVSQQEYQLSDYAERMCRAGARLARAEADRMTALTPEQPRYVLGDIGPTSRMLSMSEDVNDPASRSITFDELAAAFEEQMRWLVEEGVDALLVETIFDTLNAKAAIYAYQRIITPPQPSPQGEGALKSDLSPSICANTDDNSPSPCGEGRGGVIPLMLSMTVSDASGRTLSGQTVPAFCLSVAHARPLSIGMNCGLGPDGMLPLIQQMRQCVPAETFVSCHPNAGLPNEMGEYDVSPQDMVAQMRPMLEQGLVDIIGGCCGTTPEHIAALTPALSLKGEGVLESQISPNTLSNTDENSPSPFRERTGVREEGLSLSGLEPYYYNKEDFIVVGERCNVAGSRKFLRLISERQYDEALDIARRQVERGAMVIDINMDDGLLDARQEMRTFLNLLASDPAVARVPVMVDSSRFDVIEEGLKCCQGKAIVNSISLKQGEAEFLRQARVVKSLGAAVIVMCFDEAGQATDYERRIQICQRAYRLLTEQVGFHPTDIIFDPNILTIATGMAEHAHYALDFIRATQWITTNLPGTRVSGGLSNLSFAFRGNNPLREAMHAVFLHLARQAGMGMAIMNPATAVKYEDMEEHLRKTLEDVILNKNPEALDALLQIAERMKKEQEELKAKKEAGATVPQQAAPKADSTPAERIRKALLEGIEKTLEADLNALLNEGQTPLQIISGPLMQGMNEVGRLFGEGKMFLPQVVKTARTMKRAVETLTPALSLKGEGALESHISPNTLTNTEENSPSPFRESAGVRAEGRRGVILLATVKGDVHDIGKNIVGVVMGCNGFEVIDLGVMVPCETIVSEAITRQVDIVCLSGLITPSLDEMCRVAEAMQQAGLSVPLFVGGATTSAIHTAVKIAPLYHGGVFHMRDAAQDPVVAMQFLDPAQRDRTLAENLQQQLRIRLAQQQRQQRLSAQLAQAEARGEQPADRRFSCDWSNYTPTPAPFVGQRVHDSIPVAALVPLIDWPHFFWAWRVQADSPEGLLLRADADLLLAELARDERNNLRAITAFYSAQGSATGIEITLADGSHSAQCPCCGGVRRTMTIETPRQSLVAHSGATREQCLSLCDFVSPLPGDSIGAFAATVSEAFQQRIEGLKQSGADDYMLLLLQTMGDRLAEAAAEYLSRELKDKHHWTGIRPAVGYPSLPDQRSIFRLSRLIDFPSVGISLTENGAMYPQSSVSGLFISHPDARYFSM